MIDTNTQDEPLLSVRGLTTVVNARGRALKILDDVSFDVAHDQVAALVGESGSGKSMTALSIMRLLSHPATTSAGEIRFSGTDLLTLSESEMQRIRGASIAMIFQDPMSSLNPVFKIGEQIVESLRFHRQLGRREARLEAARLLDLVEIPSAANRLDDYPHQMSGGMRQRVMIAMSLACRPQLLIADEPTTALDVTVQAQILDLLRQVQREFSMSVILITHDMGIVTEFADEVTVLYAGRIAESAPVEALFDEPKHPYTQGLLASIPPLDGNVDRLTPIPGSVPSLASMPNACRFEPRCIYALPECAQVQPPLRHLGSGRRLACTGALQGVLPTARDTTISKL